MQQDGAGLLAADGILASTLPRNHTNSIIRAEGNDVASWPLADIETKARRVRYWSESGHAFRCGARQLLTHSGFRWI
jgi:hypothetical protein